MHEGRVPIVESEDLDDRKWLIERVALELRTADGMSADRVASSLAGKVAMLAAEKLIEARDGRLVLTRAGKPLSDSIAEMLLPDE